MDYPLIVIHNRKVLSNNFFSFLFIHVAVSSDEYWDLSGRLTVDDVEPTNCSFHANDDIYSNTGHPVDPSSHQNDLEYTTAPSQVSNCQLPPRM